MRKVFAEDSTYVLIKKYLIYNLMSSNFFINYALSATNLFYRVFGVRMTNAIINKTAGSLFTSGETLASLNADIASFHRKNIGGIANYVVEGLSSMNESHIDKICADLIDGVTALTATGTQGHLAIKLTALLSIAVMTNLSKSQ
jgi:hypothetical protein